jgi:outer membrane receptor protein involved in Fe transport
MHDKDLQRIAEYMMPEFPARRSDLGFLFGTRHGVPEFCQMAYALWQQGMFKLLVVSGGQTGQLARAEAEIIGDELVKLGFPQSALILETAATNTGENVRFGRSKVAEVMDIAAIRSVVVIGKICSTRRYLMTLQRHWPGLCMSVCPVNYFGVPAERWHEHDEFRARVISEFEKIPLYLQKGFLEEIPGCAPYPAFAQAPAFRGSLRTTLSVLLFGLVALSAKTRAEDRDPVSPTVTVTGKKEAVVKKLDKTVYNVADMPRAANGSAQDVLQSTPDVSVTADGQISVKGNAQVTILVDGKPTAMMSGSADDRAVALQTMSGAHIASIEVITNPSAAYNANGGAILNIVLKRNRKPGAHAQVQGSASDQGLWNIGASGDMTREQISVHGSLAFRRDGTEKSRQSEVDWNNPLSGQVGESLQSSGVFVHRIVESAGLGTDYALSDTDSLSLSTRYNHRRSRPVFDVLNEDRTGAAKTIFHRISDGPNQQSDDSASLGYSHQDTGAVVKAMIQRSDTIGLVDKSYSDVFVEPALATDYSRGATRSARHLTQATIDWTHLSEHGAEHGEEHGQLGMGLDFQDQVDDLYNYQASVDPLTGAETPDSMTTNGYAVKTTVTAVYLTDKIRHGKWEMLLGGRAERMALRLNSAQGTTPTEHWQAFNPSLHLKYAFNDKSDLTLSYRRSLQMPDPRDLNPFTTYVDAQNLSRGNPGLKPQRLTSWELGTNTEAAHLRADVSVFYRSSRNTVLDARSFDADNVLVTSKQNGGHARSAGITGSLDWTPDAKLRLGIDGGAYRVTLYTPDLAGLVRQDGIAGYVILREAYSIGHDDVSLDAHGQSAGITPLGRYGATSSLNLAWKHPLTKTLSLTVNANDVFDGSRRTYSTDTSTFRRVGFDHFVAQRIYVGFVKTIGI